MEPLYQTKLHVVPATVKSKCVSKCKLVGTVCEGCGRTIDEIIEAGKAHHEQRSIRHESEVNCNSRGTTRTGG